MITIAAGAFTAIFAPKLDYLPTGNRNFVFGFVNVPPGYNLDEVSAITERIAARTRDLWAPVSGPEPAADGDPPNSSASCACPFPAVPLSAAQRLIQIARPSWAPLSRSAAAQEPGTRAFARQPSLFGRSIGSGRTIDLDIRGNDLQTDLRHSR